MEMDVRFGTGNARSKSESLETAQTEMETCKLVLVRVKQIRWALKQQMNLPCAMEIEVLISSLRDMK
jgi:hypothetical protein